MLPYGSAAAIPLQELEMAAKAWDTLITNALVFDGTGTIPRQVDIAVKDGKVAARAHPCPLPRPSR